MYKYCYSNEGAIYAKGLLTSLNNLFRDQPIYSDTRLENTGYTFSKYSLISSEWSQ